MNETKNYSITKSGAVILEGGANRGVFTAETLDFLMEQEYYIPHVIGVSAGAAMRWTMYRARLAERGTV